MQNLIQKIREKFCKNHYITHSSPFYPHPSVEGKGTCRSCNYNYKEFKIEVDKAHEKLFKQKQEEYYKYLDLQEKYIPCNLYIY